MFLSCNVVLRYCGKAVLVLLFLISPAMYAQLNGTYTIPGSYATLGAAISALNTSGVSGPVVFNVAAGHTETLSSPTAGTITATGTASNTITFQKSGTGANPLITAGTGTGFADGIIKIAGGDYITFNGIDLTEKGTNSTTNQMMEWGYALVKKSATAPFDGCQYVTIKNCTVTMSKANTSSVAVYANNHIATSTGLLTITATTDAMNNITIDNVVMRNANSGINFSGYSGAPSPYSLYNQNIEVKNCDIQNFGVGTTGYGIAFIYCNNVVAYNNTVINDGAGGSGSTTGIHGIAMAIASNGNFTARSNTVKLNRAGGTGFLYGISNYATGNAIINNNTIQNFVSASGSGVIAFVNSSGNAGSITIDSNTIGNSLNLNSSGAIYGIYQSTNSSSSACRYNVINNISKATTTTGSLFGYFNAGNSTGGVCLIKNNTISNLTSNSTTINGVAAGFYGIYQTQSVSWPVTLDNNTLFNLTGDSGGATAIAIDGGTNASTCSGNNVYSITSSGTSYGIRLGVLATPTAKVWTLSGNTVRSVASTSAGGAAVAGISLSLGTSTSNTVIAKNNIYDLAGSGAAATVYGITVAAGTTSVTAYNNFISDLKAPDASASPGVAAFYLNSGNATTAHGLYYNSVFLNASSTSSSFGSSCVYANTTYGLDMRNNILVNMSQAGNGSALAKSAVYRRSNSTLTSYSGTSDCNLMYANPGAASKAIYMDSTNYDSTLADYKARMVTRDQFSVSELPPFINTTTTPYNLHLNTAVASLANNSGNPVSSPVSITDDFDGNTRNALTPDIGADEYSGISLRSLLRLTAIVEGLYNVSGNTMIPDTMKVYLRKSFSPYTTVDSATVLLSNAGLGVYSFTKQIRGSSYYLQLFNKRALETWSKTPVTFSTDTVSYDFTTAANKAYGDNQVLKGTKYCLYSGDANGDGVIDFGDLIQIDNDNANFVTGDSSSDLNGDGVVDLTDLLLADNNNANFIARITPLTAKRPVAKRVTVTGETQKTQNGTPGQK